MKKIAIVDDSPDDLNLILQYLKQYQEENHLALSVDTFHSGIDFIESYSNNYDAVFLDIEMPGTDGMSVARELRKLDHVIGIVFITNMVQFAVQGYEVNAIDFIVKPVSYYNFADKMDKVLTYIRERSENKLLLSGPDGFLNVDAGEIYYVSKDKNYLLYHTLKGDFRMVGTMQALKEKLESMPFIECNSGYLINISYIDEIRKDTVIVHGSELPVSRRKKKELVQKVMDYLGGTL